MENVVRKDWDARRQELELRLLQNMEMKRGRLEIALAQDGTPVRMTFKSEEMARLWDKMRKQPANSFDVYVMDVAEAWGRLTEGALAKMEYDLLEASDAREAYHLLGLVANLCYEPADFGGTGGLHYRYVREALVGFWVHGDKLKESRSLLGISA